VIEEEPLPKADRDRLGVIMSEMYLTLVRLDPDSHPRDNADIETEEPSDSKMNDAVRRAGASLEWVRRERPDLAPEASSKERYTWEQHEHIREYCGLAYPLDENDRSTVPVWETWSRYIREYLRLTDGRVNFTSRGRTGRSLVRPDEIHDYRGDD